MTKRKKTLEQKRLIDTHRQAYSLNSYTFTSSAKKDYSQTNLAPQTTTISYLKQDILKTSVLTISILMAQIALLILLKNHVVTVPLVSY